LVTGVPLGTFIGQHLGWCETVLAVLPPDVIALIGSYVPEYIAHKWCSIENLPSVAPSKLSPQPR